MKKGNDILSCACKDIPNYESFIKIEPINKGVSGDYHNENLLVSENHEIAIIDWDLLDSLYGDPWSEFNRISMCTNFSPYFATGLLNGYFGGEPPEEFWKILALYLSTGALILVSWAANIEPGCLEECKQKADKIIQWFDRMHNSIPTWYFKDFSIDNL